MVEPRPHPQSKSSVTYSSKAPSLPRTFCGQGPALRGKASPPGSHRKQPGLLLRSASTQTLLEAARCTAAHIWNPAGLEPRGACSLQNPLCAGSRQGDCVHLLRPADAPPPPLPTPACARRGPDPAVTVDPRAAPSAVWVGQLPARVPSGSRPFQPRRLGRRGGGAARGAGSPGRAHGCKLEPRALAFARVDDRRCPPGRPQAAAAPGGREASGGGPGAAALGPPWPAARRVQTGPGRPRGGRPAPGAAAKADAGRSVMLGPAGAAPGLRGAARQGPSPGSAAKPPAASSSLGGIPASRAPRPGNADLVPGRVPSGLHSPGDKGEP